MKDDDFKLLRGFADEQTDGRTDNICDCRVAFATEKKRYKMRLWMNKSRSISHLNLNFLLQSD